MKRFIAAAFAAVCLFPFPGRAQNYNEEPEIIIEMHGETSAPGEGVSVWDKDARQLTRLFRGKDRTYVLYRVENVSSKDDILRAENGTEYAFVRYGSDNGDYRKFLFKAEHPQTFVACAANVRDVLAVNKKYGVNLGVYLNDFLQTYENEAEPADLTDEPAGTALRAYRLNYTDVNHKIPATRYFVFENNRLSRTLEGEDAFMAYKRERTSAGLTASRRNDEQQQTQPPQEQRRQEEAARNGRPVQKALISGGTVTDRMYMPRVLNPKPMPPVKPSKLPAGTPVL